jgi:hypothetical protein
MVYINPLKTKHRLLYLKTQSISRSKHFSSLDSPFLIFSMLSFGCFPGVWFLLADVSEHSICSIFKADDLEVM